MEQIYHNHNMWEDYKNGMYKVNCRDSTKCLKKARELLSTPYLFIPFSKKVVVEWRYAAEQNLTNRSRNRRAWVGQASCCFFAGVPEFITKTAWHELSPYEQDRANKIADDAISLFEYNLFNSQQLTWELKFS